MPLTLRANDLRRLAEAADNCDNRTVHAVVLDADKFSVVPLSDVAGRPVVMQIDNSSDMPAAGKNGQTSEASIVVNGTPLSLRTPPLDILPDCAFWGEAAMRKFVVPYYTREMTPEELADLWAAIRAPEVIAITHVCPSDYHKITVPGDSLTLHRAREAVPGDPEFVLPEDGGPVTVFDSLSFEDWRAR
ncbi:MAG: hypothetical protein ABI625_08800 [bacterium]